MRMQGGLRAATFYRIPGIIKDEIKPQIGTKNYRKTILTKMFL